MVAEILVLLVPVLVLGLLAFLQATHRARRRLPMWKAVASIAHSLGLDLRESRTAPYGVPEAFGIIGGRPIDFRVAPGKSSLPIRTVISVGHRLPVRSDVYFARGSASKWVLGVPSWKEVFVGDSPKEAQVRVTGRVPEDVNRLIALFGPAEVRQIINLMGSDEVYVGALRSHRLDVQLAGLETNRDSLNSIAQDVLDLASALEARVPTRELEATPGSVEPKTPILSPRAIDSGLMGVVLILAGILAVVPFLPEERGNSATPETYALFWSFAGILALIAGSRLAAAHLGAAERRILAQFRKRDA